MSFLWHRPLSWVSGQTMSIVIGITVAITFLLIGAAAFAFLKS